MAKTGRFPISVKEVGISAFETAAVEWRAHRGLPMAPLQDRSPLSPH